MYLGASTEYQIGARGADVARIQVTLNALGYNVGDADGIFGPKTKLGVAKYQSDNGLAPDGIVGAKTWALLMGERETVKPIPLTPTQSTGAKLQPPTPPNGTTRLVMPAPTLGGGINWLTVGGILGGLALLTIMVGRPRRV